MKKSVTVKTNRRMMFVLAIFILLVTVLISRLFLIQIVRGEELQAKALQQQTRAEVLDASRGAIYDRNMNFLAKSAPVWNVCISPAEISAGIDKEKEPNKLNEMAQALGEILEISPQKILDEAKDTKFYYKRIKRRIEAETRDAILKCITENKYPGVFFEQTTKRYYPFGSLASTLLGFTNGDNQGAYGLESYYNNVLAGSSGMVVSTKNAWGADMPLKYSQKYDAKDGNSIVLTIDEGVQHFVERNLETAIIEHNIADKACAIVMDVNTGEIMAMATKPDFDPNEPYVIADPTQAALLDLLQEGSEEYKELQKELWFAQWRNKAISDPYEPGSVFKIITASTGLDTGTSRLTDHFFCTGSIQVAGETIRCWKAGGHGSLDFKGAIQNSCNPAFIAIGQRIGADNFYQYLDNFGLLKPTGIDLPGEAGSIFHTYKTLAKEGMVELSSSSFGQSNKVTAIQLITAVSAAVNGGYLMEPYVVKQIVDTDGNIVETREPTVRRQVVSEETAAIMRDLVESVVDGGSGKLAALPGYRIGGKTGTSEKLDGDSRDHILSFVGFAPMEEPKYAILVMLDSPELEDAYGSVIAAPVVGAIFKEMLPYLGIEPQYTAEELEQKEVSVPSLLGKKPHDAQAELVNMGLQVKFIGNGSDVIKQIPQPGQKIIRGGTVILYTEEQEIFKDIMVPDVVGMTAQEANKILTDTGLNIELRGTLTDGIPTIVREQWPLAGSSATTGDVIVVTLVKRPDSSGVEILPTIGENQTE